MNKMTWKTVLLLLVAIPVINIVAGQLGRNAGEKVNARESSANQTTASNQNPSIKTIVSSQDAEGITREDLNLTFLKNLEAHTVERATIKAKEYLASVGYPNLNVTYTSEANYVESGSVKLALIRLKAEGSRQIFIAGIVGNEFKRVLCSRESEQELLVASGPCGDKIKEIFGVSLGPS